MCILPPVGAVLKVLVVGVGMGVGVIKLEVEVIISIGGSLILSLQ